MKLTVNGETKHFSQDPKSLEQLIILLEYHPRLIVVEHNGLIIPPKDWCKQKIKNKDTIEIVTIVGGGY